MQPNPGSHLPWRRWRGMIGTVPPPLRRHPWRSAKPTKSPRKETIMSLRLCVRVGSFDLAFIMVAAAVAGITSARTAVAVEPPQVTIKPTEDGLAIDAGSMGRFVLSYPAIYQKGEHNYEDAKAYKLVEKQPAGNAALLKYAGGAQAKVEVQANQTVLVSFSALPSDVQQFRMGMHIDVSYGQGGRFKIGQATEQPFPQEKPAKPHLYQGNDDTLVLKNSEGKTLTFLVPQYSFQQLTDNREWNWNIFEWWFAVPYDPGQETYQLKITPGAGDAAGSK